MPREPDTEWDETLFGPKVPITGDDDDLGPDDPDPGDGEEEQTRSCYCCGRPATEPGGLCLRCIESSEEPFVTRV